ncbi:MAG: acyltransferase [bacterium]|jgi:acetyltransferase-like isoleucine patch superfamily enzyme|nr:acyltransferase [bacterium]
MALFDETLLQKRGSEVHFWSGVDILHPELVSIGNHVSFHNGVFLSPCGKWITIGDHCHFAPYAVLYGPLTIGNEVAVAAHVVFASVGHGYDRIDIPMVQQKSQTREIIVEDDVWIGANAVIIGGVRIGAHSIVGAGAVVTHDVEPYSVVGGTPARLIRKRDADG